MEKGAKRYLRSHLRTETAGLLRFRPDPVWQASPQLEAAFRSFQNESSAALFRYEIVKQPEATDYLRLLSLPFSLPSLYSGSDHLKMAKAV